MNTNPFGVPDFSAMGDTSSNPLLKSMDMMAQAWKSMAAGAQNPGSGAMPMLSLEELERRIRDLRAVESWLQLNLSMLGTTIQGLEIQRSTLLALKSMSPQAGAGAPNPFDMLMGFRPAGSSAPQAASSGQDAAPEGAPAAQAWWNMLQQQFDAMASATAASLKQAEAFRAQAAEAQESARRAEGAGSAPSVDEGAGQARKPSDKTPPDPSRKP